MEKLTPESDFLVRENIVLHLILGILFSIMFIISLTDKIGYDYEQFYFKAMYLSLLPAIFFLRKAIIKRKTIIQINKTGLFYFGELITNWSDFIDAVVTQDEKIITFQDNFVLFVRYRNEEGRIFRSRIPLTNTQDKAEEEIIAAIRFFSRIK